MTYNERMAAQVAGGTLGFIWNNVPGAVAGYSGTGRLYDYTHRKSLPKTQLMPPVRFNRIMPKNNPYMTPMSTRTPLRPITLIRSSRSSNGRRVSLGPSDSASRRGSDASMRTATRTTTASSYRTRSSVSGGSKTDTNVTHARAMKIKKGKKVRIKAGRRVKVSRKLRKKITKVIEGKSVTGTLDNIRSDGKLLLSAIPTGTQVAIAGSNDGRFPWMFTADQFMTAVSTCFNNYVQQDGGYFYLNPDSAGVVDVTKVQFRIIDSWCSYSFKNLSARALSLKIYECAPNEIGWTNITSDGSNTSKNFSGGTWTNDTLTTADNYSNPQMEWVQALDGDFQTRRLITTAGGSVATVTQGLPHLTPQKSGKFNARFRVSVRYVCLCPGQVYDMTVQGPKGVDVKGEAFLKEGKWYNVRKYSRCLMTVVLPDLATELTSTPKTGYHASAAGDATNYGPALAIARRDHYKVSVPETAAVGDRKNIAVWNDVTVKGGYGVNLPPQQPGNPTSR